MRLCIGYHVSSIVILLVLIIYIDVTTCAARRILSSESILRTILDIALLKTANMELLLDHETIDGPHA